MTTISHNIKTISDQAFPSALHDKIMRRLLLLKFKNPFIVLMIFLSVNLIISGWRTWNHIVSMESLSIMRAMLDGFELSFAFFTEFFSTMADALPLASLAIFISNALLMAYVFFLFVKFRKMSLHHDRALHLNNVN